VTGLPAVEVHISKIAEREAWRAHSVIREVVIGHVEGKGVDGYRDALVMLKEALA
jgi:3-dehydroquinate dehydratase-2